MTSLTTPAARADLPRTSDWPGMQRWGGRAALLIAITYVVGFLAMGAYLVPAGFTDALSDPAASVDFLLQHQAALYVWYLVLYLLGGAALVVLALAIHHRLARSQPALAAVTTGFGLVWSGHLLASGMVALLGQRAVVELAAGDRERAEGTWLTLTVVQDALGGGIELVGALWLLLVSVAALRARSLGRGAGIFGAVVGSIGLVTVVPVAAEGATSLFGLGMIVWFGLVGRALLATQADGPGPASDPSVSSRA